MTDGQDIDSLQKLAKLVRYFSLAASTAAGSGHPTSSLSAADLMVGLMFGGTFRYDVDHPDHPNNDRLIFSKGHASPLFYSLWLAAGVISEEEMMTYRQFRSPLEGHPTPRFRFTEAATGSLGQGLSIGVGEALNARYLDKLPYRVFVLLGDSEMAEGSQWEAMEIASYYGLGNLVGVMDVNRLGQRGQTMYGWDLEIYRQRAAAFGWNPIVIDGHDFREIHQAYAEAGRGDDQPTMIIARTIKGKGVAEIEDKNGWHGKALDKQLFDKAVSELGEIDMSFRGKIPRPEDLQPAPPAVVAEAEAFGAVGAATGHDAASNVTPPLDYPKDQPVATRRAYGSALVRLYAEFPNIVCLDGEVSNSTGADRFKEAYPDAYFEMFIAEQNMAGVALGLSRRGKLPFASTFAAFWTRAFDQIRMSRYSDANLKFVGSHAGVSIGQDGPSQMGLEDIAMFRTVLDSVVLHPCDAVSTEKLVEQMARTPGIAYLRTLRQETPILYDSDDEFPIGGSKVLRRSDNDVATIVGAGQTVWEALAAADQLADEDIAVRVIDLYSIKPIDEATLRQAAEETKVLITVEDHYAAGGVGEAVVSALAGAALAADASRVEGAPTLEGASSAPKAKVHILAVANKPMSGSGADLRDFEGISAKSIVDKVKQLR